MGDSSRKRPLTEEEREIAIRLKRAATTLGNQAAQAEVAGVSESTWFRWVNGKRAAELGPVLQVTKELGTDLYWLAYGTPVQRRIDPEILASALAHLEALCAKSGKRPTPEKFANIVLWLYEGAAKRAVTGDVPEIDVEILYQLFKAST